jgi:hypothetical protein
MNGRSAVLVLLRNAEAEDGTICPQRSNKSFGTTEIKNGRRGLKVVKEFEQVWGW